MNGARASIIKNRLVLLGATLWTGLLHAGGPGTSSGNVLKMSPSPRASAMGEAYTAVADGADALFWNPAGLIRIQKRSVLLTHGYSGESTAVNYGAYGQKAGDSNAWAVGIHSLTHGTLTGADGSGNDTSSFTPNDLALSLGGAHTFKSFRLGASVKYVRSTIVKTATTATADIGLLSRGYLKGKLRLALTATNLFGSLTYDQAEEQLPRAIRAGGAYRIRPRWLASAELAIPNDGPASGGVGTEVEMAKTKDMGLTGRAGYTTRANIPGAGISAGLGVRFKKMNIDYAFVPLGDVGQSHQMSIAYRF